MSKSTGITPAEVFLGEAGRPLVEQFPEVAGKKLAEAEPQAVQSFGKWVAAKVKKLKEAARANEQLYLRQGEEQYNAGLQRDGVRTTKLQLYNPGQLIMVKLPAIGAFGQRSKGPLIVLADKGDSLKVRNLITGRINWENKCNCLPLKTIM